MKQDQKDDLKAVKKDHDEIRKFIKEIHLKLRKRKPQDEEFISSLYEMITK